MPTGTRWTKLMVVAGTGFGLGLSPVAPGTVGSIPGILLVLAVGRLGVFWQVAAAVTFVLIAVPVCGVAERYFEKKDDRRVVADEYLTFPICMIGLPLTPWMLAIAFASNRFFDVVKLPPARALQTLNGGLGVVADDVFAALYSLAANHAAYWLISRYLLI